ncbi:MULTISPECIES: TldD/PmbA family protein [unclassified Leptolyngbya]|uniref:TldD/PmbA family protein n=1 Tax=unclassified Leptolyngbya TaxID=2650499 RepID=UPI001687C04E|nr:MULTISPECIES: TldD/PmbA family protein [unclassified Leptolyngbya]MBD1913603.1 TldD/PmbA family protein [Leptolyngbya sp. FACHB-8]MBD2154066.1 TldD/PmbA family protein [Leptolyngbya sp. FACHB-16]
MISDLQRALSAVTLPADWVGIRAVRQQSTYRSVRDGLPQGNSRSLNQGAMVEVMAGGQIGYGAVNSLDPDAIQEAARIAYEQAIAAQAWAIHSLTPSVRPPVVGQYVSPVEKPLDVLSVGDINDILVRLCNTLKVDDRIVQTSAMATTEEVETWFVSSNGSDAYQKLVLLQTHYGATAQDGAVVQQRTDNGPLAHCYQGGWELFLTQHLWDRAHQIGEQAVELLTAEECPTERTTLVLAPDQMMLQIHESVGHPLELDRILGDERNYAGGSFVKPEDFGSLSYGAPLMNITFNPNVPGEFASYRFDDTGATASKEYLIQEGRLLRGLGSLESQQRLGVPGVACARASSWNRPPIDRMANLNLEAGTESLEELIGNIESGVYMEANRSWSIDDQRYKFQFGCEYARKIEQGKLTQPLRNPNYRGTTPEFWHSLMKVGRPDTWEMYGTPYCGKGEPNQAIRVGHGSPVCAFDGVEVFGGG